MLSTLIILLGVSAAYAEQATLEVPFDYENYPSMDNHCVHFDLIQDLYSCLFEEDVQSVLEKTNDGDPLTENIDCSSVGMVYNPQTGDCITEEQVKQEYLDEISSEPVKSPEQKRLEYLNNLPDPNTTEQELIKKINGLLEDFRCYQGIGTTLGVQTPRDFAVPVVDVPVYEEIDGVMVDTGETKTILDTSVPLSPVNLRGYIGSLIADALECKAEAVLLDIQGGVLSSADATFGKCDNSDHMNMEQSISNGCGLTSANFYNTLKETVKPRSQAYIESIQNQPFEVIENPMCYSDNSVRTKLMYGCVIEEKPSPSLYDPPELKNSDAVQAIIDAVKRFDDGDESQQLEAIAKKIKETASASARNVVTNSQK